MKLYDSLHDIPLYNWEQFGRTNDAKYLINKDSDENKPNWLKMFNFKHGVNLFTDEEIDECFFGLYDQILEMTETKYDLEERAQLILELMNARVKYVEGDLSQMNMINYFEKMLSEMDGGEKVDTVKNRMIIQKHYGLVINPKEVSVAEFIAISNIVKENNKSVNNLTDEDAAD